MPDPNYFNQFEKADDDYFSQFEKEPSLAVSHGKEPESEGYFNQGLDLAAAGLKKGGELIKKIDSTFGVHDKPGEPKLNPLPTSPGEIPGVRAGADYIQNKLQNTGNYGLGYLGGLVSYGGELAANAFDPGNWFIKGESGIPKIGGDVPPSGPSIPDIKPNVPEPQRLLPSGARFTAGEEGIADVIKGEQYPPKQPSSVPNKGDIPVETIYGEWLKGGSGAPPLKGEIASLGRKKGHFINQETIESNSSLVRNTDKFEWMMNSPSSLKAELLPDSPIQPTVRPYEGIKDVVGEGSGILKKPLVRTAQKEIINPETSNSITPEIILKSPNPILHPTDANAYIQAVRSGEAKGIGFEEWKKSAENGILTESTEVPLDPNNPIDRVTNQIASASKPKVKANLDGSFSVIDNGEVIAGNSPTDYVNAIDNGTIDPKTTTFENFKNTIQETLGRFITDDEGGLKLDPSTWGKDDLKNSGIKVKKGEDFAFDGNWNVKFPDGKETKIFYDKASQIWYEDKPTTKQHTSHYSDLFGYSKEELIAKIHNFINDESGSLKLDPREWGKKSDKEGKPVITRRAPTQTAMGKLIDALKEHSFDREKQELIYAEDKGKRIANFANEIKEGGGKSAFFKGVGKMAGEYDKISPVEVKMGARDVTALYNQINLSKKITDFEKLRTGLALAKLLEGKSVLQRNELALFDRVFGTGTSAQIMELHGGIGLTGIKLAKTANTMKSLQSTIDLSVPFRQGIGLAHRKEYWNAFSEMFKYAKSEEAFSAAMKSIEEHPNYLFNRESGLFIADHEIGGHEEQFMDSYLNDFHDLLKKKLDPAKVDQYSPTRASERAYVGFLNKLRADTMNALLQKYEKAGIPLYTMKKGKRIPNEFTRQIAKYINVSTGRGNLLKTGKYTAANGKIKYKFDLNKSGLELNTLIYSPRLISSRLSMLNPKYYVDLPKPLRMEAVKSLMAIAGAVGITNTLGSIMGGKTTLTPNKVNLTNPDFGKLKLGKVREDPGGGFLQYIVAASQFLTNSSTSSTSGVNYPLGRYGQPTRGSKVLGVMGSQPSFLENKLSPMARLADDIMSMPGRTEVNGQPINIPTHIRKAFTPLFIQDVMDLYKTDPDLLPLAIPAALGQGITSYQDRPNNGNEGLKLPGLSLR